MKGRPALATHRFLMRLAFSAANVFAWVMVFQFIDGYEGNASVALGQTALLYLLSYIATYLKLPYAATRLRSGMRVNMLLGAFCAIVALAFLGLALSGAFAYAATLGLLAFALLMGAYRALYRLPYAIDVREEHLHAPSAVSDMIIALVPTCAGLLLALPLPTAWLLYGITAIIFFGALALFFVPDISETFPWGYRETFRQLFLRERRILLWRSLLRGAEAAALFLLWPIFVFMVLQQSYAALGLIFSLTILVGILLHDTGRLLLQRWQVHDSPSVEAALVASAWIGRLAVLSPISVVIVDSYANVSAPRETVPPAHYERVADGGLYIDEQTILKEMGESLGRMFACFIAAVFAFTFSIPFAFISCFVLAGAAAAIGVGLNRLPARSL